MKKLLAVGVIVLFLGLAIAPSINANISKASVDSELVEITTEVCGMSGGKHTVKLTKEEADELEQYLKNIERKLDEVETRQETIEIFEEAIIELDKYGLLGGLSIEQAQNLVTGKSFDSRILRLIENIRNRNIESANGDDYENFLCLTYAHGGYGGKGNIFAGLGALIDEYAWNYLYGGARLLLSFIGSLIFAYGVWKPFFIMNIAGLTGDSYNPMNLITIGTKGRKNHTFNEFDYNGVYVLGCSGIHIAFLHFISNNNLFLGYSLYVNELPEWW